MTRQTIIGFLAALSSVAFLRPAQAASIADCGNIHVEASAQCKVESGLACQANCTPINCSAALYAECTGECTATLPTCEVDCSGSCQGKCSANASLDCNADCKATCGVNCDSKCAASCAAGDAGDTNCVANCKASCSATCQGECDVSCQGSASLDCSGKCQASCKGSCNGSARIDCQAQCQARGYASCTGGCQVACQRTGEGGLFCNGQWVDDNNNLQNCINALQAALNIQVSGTASCSGSSCQAEGKASASCATAPGGPKDGAIGGSMLLAIGGLAVGARRRRLRARA